VAVSEKNGSDRYIGRRLPRLLGQAGLADVRVNPIVHVPAPGDARRTLLVDFVDNLRERILALNLATGPELADLKETLAAHLDNPDTVMFHGPDIQAWAADRRRRRSSHRAGWNRSAQLSRIPAGSATRGCTHSTSRGT